MTNIVQAIKEKLKPIVNTYFILDFTYTKDNVVANHAFKIYPKEKAQEILDDWAKGVKFFQEGTNRQVNKIKIVERDIPEPAIKKFVQASIEFKEKNPDLFEETPLQGGIKQ